MTTALASPGQDPERARWPIVVARGLWLLALTANLLTWLCCAIGAVVSFSGFGSSDAARSIAADPDPIPGVPVLYLLGQVQFLVPMLGLLPVLVLVFPTGRLPSRRWRPVLWLVAAGLALYAEQHRRMGTRGRAIEPTRRTSTAATTRVAISGVVCR